MARIFQPPSAHRMSRFILETDASQRTFLLDLPAAWWSAPYAYSWAATFARPTDIVLDAGSGVGQPFKFYMADLVKTVHAVDSDPRILSPLAMLEALAENFGLDAVLEFPTDYIERLYFEHGSLTALPYNEGSFDTIFCLAVLDQLSDEMQIRTLMDFKRVLKRNGLMVLTFEHPTVNVQLIAETAKMLGLNFLGPVELAVKPGALTSPEGARHCFRAVLQRTS